MRILSKKFLSPIVFVGLLHICSACSNTAEPAQPSSPPSPEPQHTATPVVETAPRPFDPKLDIGVVLAGGECSELLIRNPELKPGDEILVVVLADDMPQKKLLAKIVGSEGCPPRLSSIEEIVVGGDESAPSHYEIRFEEGSDFVTGFAVVAENARVEIVKGLAHVIAHDRLRPLFFRTCSGHESFHMTVWDGKPLVGKRVWHSYMHLSYDTVPTCKPSEYR